VFIGGARATPPFELPIMESASQRPRFGTGQEGTARAGAGSDVLHDVEAAVLKRPGRELAPSCDVFCLGRRGEKLGADLPGSPIMAADDPEERTTILMVWVGNWSDGSPAPSMQH
jgi:hypothetical protein